MALLLGGARLAFTQCGGDDPIPVPNVLWALKDSVAACPAGDTLSGLTFPPSVGPRPSRLRILVYYSDVNECAKVGVPPESIWVTTSIVQGNLKVNDAAQKTYADDSTDTAGFARITLPSFSGCGKVSVQLRVSGIPQGGKTATVRTADTDASGRVDQADVTAGACDLNYNSTPGEAEEQSVVQAHSTDWHRNALHGTLVQRTSPPTVIATGDLCWSPSGRRIVFSVPGGGGTCLLKHVAADASAGNNLTQFTWLADLADDYDPTWSPLGDEIFFSRGDRKLYRKGIPGLATDTSEVLLFTGTTGTISTSVSPDGKTIAFSRAENVPARYTIWTIPATGGTPRRITAPSDYYDWYPKWSPDGQTIIFDRRVVSTGHRSAYTVPAFEEPPPLPTPFYDVAGQHAALASYAADGAVIAAGVGPNISATIVHTMDATGTPGFRPIENYAGYTTANLFPRLSPDGTRLAVFAKAPGVPGATTQVWAVRRNMNLPPNFTDVGGQTVADSTTRVYFTMLQGLPYSFAVTASDPADPVPEPLTYIAYYLQLGMAFDLGTRTFTWTPPAGTAGQTFHVRFAVTTPSGGTDAIIAVISVAASLGPGSRASLARPAVSAVPGTDGLVRFAFHNATPRTAELTVFDLAGRRLARLTDRAADALHWDGRDESGRLVASGIYFYRIRAGEGTFAGRLVYLRR